MEIHQGGCLCGAIRYQTSAAPLRVTTCHCRFCQRATGGAYMVEPIFAKEDFIITAGVPKIYDQVSAGSGKVVHVHFCPDCGTKTHLSFERFTDVIGVYAGTFDDPTWFEITPDNAKHIFLGVARPDTAVPAGVPTYVEHTATTDGTPCTATIFEVPQLIGDL